VSIEKSNNKIGKRVRLIFGTCLQIKDKEILTGIANYFYNYFEYSNSAAVLFKKQTQLNEHLTNKYIYDTATTSLLQIKNNSDIQNIIIPFFNKYPILGVKSLDFNDFKLVANLMNNKEHLTPKGLNLIIEIVNGMNLDRKF
jgi:hypothetical protein